jgi:hypothetical protein
MTRRKFSVLYRSLALLLLLGVVVLGGLPVSATGLGGQLLRHQIARLEAMEPVPEEGFGAAIAISGGTVVIGAPYAYDYGFQSGAAYIFQYDPVGQGWIQVARLTASDAGPSQRFGTAVAIEGDTVIVGAPVSIPGGAAYVFYRDQGGPNAWGQVSRIVGLNTSWNDYFGYSLALDGDTLVVGAYAGGDYDGQAYVFYRNQGGPDAWGQVAWIVGSDVVPYDYFGSAVAVSGDTAIVGACGSGDNSTGAAYIFQRDEGGPHAWGQVAKIGLPDGTPDDWFGLPVAIHGDIAAVSAQGRAPDGAVYFFYRDQGGLDQWGQATYITATEPIAGTSFGVSLSLISGTLAVGAPSYTPGGAAYLFARHQGGSDLWGRVARLEAADPEPDAALGSAVSLYGEFMAAGAPGDEPGGSAYLFLLTSTPPGDVVISDTVVPAYEGQPRLLTGRFSDLDLDDRFTVTVDWGDGGNSLAAVGGNAPTYVFTASYTYTNGPTTYPITVTVVDGEGASAGATATITVNNVPPALEHLVAAAVDEGASAVLTGTILDPGVLDSFSLTLAWGDGATDTLALPAGTTVFTTVHPYLDDPPGEAAAYTITLAVCDNDGGTDQAAVPAVVRNVAPTLPTLPDQEVAAGALLTLTLTFADPGLLDGHTAVVQWTPTVSWTAALSAGVTAFTTTYTYTVAARYTATVVVADDDGGVGERAFVVTVHRTGYAIFLPLVIR